ncbi:MAG: hypothetical protein HQL48_08700 [Gammaproteobacteria bacterium]|nr:hypothetical protein [Gammaproteobacteria bacterium]
MNELLILANSIKKSQRCIAGKRVDTKEWVRPVTSAEGDEISAYRCYSMDLSKKRIEVKPMQRLSIELGHAVPLLNQPENYLFSAQPWQYRGSLSAEQLEPFLDHPESLWGSGPRIDYKIIQQGLIHIEQSLLLVRVEKLQLSQHKSIDGRNKRRANFLYNGTWYNLPVTDPDFEEQIKHPNHHNILCISLGEKFDFYRNGDFCCFKIVASIL